MKCILNYENKTRASSACTKQYASHLPYREQLQIMTLEQRASNQLAVQETPMGNSAQAIKWIQLRERT